MASERGDSTPRRIVVAKQASQRGGTPGEGGGGETVGEGLAKASG